MADPVNEIVYVSWGGTGRAAALRKAMERAGAQSSSLLYLAILDDSTFGDIDASMRDLAKEELSWLLDAQLELTARQTGLEGVAVRVLVRSGDVVNEIVDVADTSMGSEVLIGAPVPDSPENAVMDLLDTVRSRIDAPVSIIEP